MLFRWDWQRDSIWTEEQLLLQQLRGICYEDDSDNAGDEDGEGAESDNDSSDSGAADGDSGNASSQSNDDFDSNFGFDDPDAAAAAAETSNTDFGPQSFDAFGTTGKANTGTGSFDSRNADPSGKSGFNFRDELEREATQAAAQQGIDIDDLANDLDFSGIEDFDFSFDAFGFEGGFDIADVIQGALTGFASVAFGPIAGIAVNALTDFARGKNFGQALAGAAVTALGVPGASTLASSLGITDALAGVVNSNTPESLQGAFDDLQSGFSNATTNFGSFDTSVGAPGIASEGNKNSFGSRLDALNQYYKQARGVANPGIPTQQLDDIIRGSLLGANLSIPENVSLTEDEDPLNYLRQKFGDPTAFGQGALDAESGRLGNQFAKSNDQFFQDLTNTPFDSAGSIESIINELKAPAANQISSFEANKNLNALGGKTANQFIEDQSGDARTFLERQFDNINSDFSTGLFDIERQADEAARGYKLGQPLFDNAPFETQANDFASNFPDREQSLRESLGDRTFFDPFAAISAGAGAQGLVSGGSNPAGASPSGGVVDAIAGGGGGSDDRFRSIKRSRGNVGSGAF